MLSIEQLKQHAQNVKVDVYALYLARGDPRIPWYAKGVLVLTVTYALSPIDLVPDFIPVLGYLDDLILVPAGIACAVRLMPPDVLEEYRERAKTEDRSAHIHGWTGLIIVVLIWLFVLSVVLILVVRAM
ncbi:YkvA family protein [Methanofollis sp. UBA420]|jgi:uncharacterized membrane protein YkvA (DUF1232 family)|uniref:YkvA family protein n=1 Tax=Methanofollis sp. UBA420 TaxID=1915514 RepID=UPI00316AC835